jgi:hypothetical protein
VRLARLQREEIGKTKRPVTRRQERLEKKMRLARLQERRDWKNEAAGDPTAGMMGEKD